MQYIRLCSGLTFYIFTYTVCMQIYSFRLHCLNTQYVTYMHIEYTFCLTILKIFTNPNYVHVQLMYVIHTHTHTSHILLTCTYIV